MVYEPSFPWKEVLNICAYVFLYLTLLLAFIRYKKLSPVQDIMLVYIVLMVAWMNLTGILMHTLQNTHFMNRFYDYVHLSIHILFLLKASDSERFKKLLVYTFYIYSVIWLYLIASMELYAMKPILSSTTFGLLSIYNLIFIYQKAKYSNENLMKDPSVILAIGSYIFFAGGAIIHGILLHDMQFWLQYPKARYFRITFFIGVNVFFYMLFAYSFICNRKTSTLKL